MVSYPLALLPVVTISNGQSRLAPDAYGNATGTGTPAQAIASWVSQGAAWIDVIDEDGIGAHLHHIVRSGAHLQYSGGIGDDASLSGALSTAASRIVIDAADAEWAARAVSRHPDRLAVELDVRQADVIDVAHALQHAGCQRFVVTDDAPTHHWRHEDRHLLAEFCERTSRPIITRGGIHHLSDLHELHELVPHGIDGIVLGEALYAGAFTYSEAVAAGADRFDMFCWGPPE